MSIHHLRHRGFVWWEVVAVLGILVVLAALLFPVLGTRHPPNRRAMCASNLKQIGLGFKQYIQDYDEKFPPVAVNSAAKADKKGWGKSPYGWADALQPYLKSTQIFQCPAEPNSPQTDPTQHQYTDYWFNARVSRLEESKLDSTALTILMGDGNDGKDATNARYHWLSIPQSWRNDAKSPLGRHLEGANFAFADGHVKWLQASGWKNELDNGAFSLRLKPLPLR